MKEKIFRFLKNYEKAFIPTKNYLRDESTEVSKAVNKKIAEVNCRRIIAISPVLFVLYVANAILLILRKNAEYFTAAMLISSMLAAFTLFVDAGICWIMFFNKVDNSKEMWKFRMIYRMFWPVWFVCMAILSCIQMENGYIGLSLIIACLISNLLPLYNLKEFLVNLVLSVLVIVLIVLQNFSDGLLVSTRMEIACFIAMQVIGYVAQRMQLMLWMSREYLYMEAFVDPLTELLNRRGGNALFTEEMRLLPPEAEVGVIMFDIDYFKKYNDTFGHEAGDCCLRMVGETVRETLQHRTKVLIRHGGEEFVAILFDTDETELREWAQKLCTAVYEKRLEAPVKEVADYVTVSIGISMEKLTCENLRYENLLLKADEALYQAKRAGRNCVACAGR
ncbi:MAG: GGDEF domain-containing protein [Acetatifactor sp.]